MDRLTPLERDPGRGVWGRSARRRALRALAVAPFVASTLTGCYSHARIDGASAGALVGQEVALEVNDRGRVALADSLGPSPRQVTGRLVGSTDSTFTLAVSSVRSLDGQRVRWVGERVTFGRSGVGDLQQRKLSVGRSILAGALALGALVAVGLAVGIGGSNDGEVGDRRPDSPGQEQ